MTPIQVQLSKKPNVFSQLLTSSAIGPVHSNFNFYSF